MSDGDPEDWPAQPVELRQLERSLRCQICQELYQGPVALRCGHTFCSLCIRSCLSVFSKEGRPAACPTCRDPTDQADLRPVTHLRDACAAWRAVRQYLLHQHLQAVEQQKQQPNPSSAQKTYNVTHHRVRAQQQQERSNLTRLQNGNLQQQAQQRWQPRRASATPHSAVVLEQLRQGSGYSRGHQSTPEPAITISSNGAAGSGTSTTSASEQSGDEADSQHNDSDPDWSWDMARQPQQEQQQQGAWGASGKPGSKRKSAASSSSGNPGAACSCSPEPPLAAPAGSEVGIDVITAEGDSDFEPAELQAAKRVKATQQAGPGKENRGASAAQQHESGKGQSAAAAVNPQQLPPQQPGYVACPICSCSVKATFINSHIDGCLTKVDGSQQQQQQPAGRTAAHNQKQPAPAAKVKQRLSAAPVNPAGAAGVPGFAGKGGSGLASSVAGPAPAPAGVGVGASVAPQKRGRAKVLDAPPKLCFELMKEKDLKAKLTALGLSSEGNKKVCTERYTFFRNYVLSLKDSGSSMTLKEAAAEFTRQQRKITRAASRPQSVAALAGAAATLPGPAAAQAPAGAAGLWVNSGAVDDGEAGIDCDVWGVDHSYAALIQQTRERMANKKKEDQQQQQQQMPGQQHTVQPRGPAAEAEAAAHTLGPATELRQRDVSGIEQHKQSPPKGDGRVAELQAVQHQDSDQQQCDIDRPARLVKTAAAAAVDWHTADVGMEPDAYPDSVVPESDDEL